MPLHRARQACHSERSVGGTCLSGPSFNVRSSIAFHRGLKSRDESGAKAPHSMECGDLSPLFGEGFSLHNPAVDPNGNVRPAGWKPFLQSIQWKDAFHGPLFRRWINHAASWGTTSVPLRKIRRRDLPVRSVV
ncbi:hypothetical protein THTE_0328 [Thermogutta terrifontis]|uniref:Uncharacterized protein n=1 Tax=Thermogutta terrifontis TaxID=1331910 RepID=A0A286RAF4_9BACT|nr:hypothetical protein THTE_0328 [Thermogutta terrifontis]